MDFWLRTLGRCRRLAEEPRLGDSLVSNGSFCPASQNGGDREQTSWSRRLTEEREPEMRCTAATPRPDWRDDGC